jgi:predicted SAM-dependent methyltransferase
MRTLAYTAIGKARLLRLGVVRWILAQRFVRGSGLEIGGLHRPLRLPRGARVRYVDRMTVDELRHHYPELAAEPLVPVDVVDDGETLATQPDASADFIIANHFIEHTEDPLGTLANHLRVLRPGGVLFLAVPDRRHSFDIDRPTTPLDHVVRDHREGPAWSKPGHHEEWARLVDKVSEEEVPDRVRVLAETDYSIHFHVWEPDGFRALLEHARTVEGLPFDVAAFRPNPPEFIAILRRR